jgi:hypothetical protein
MKRKTFRKLKAAAPPGFHHYVYIVLLHSSAVKDPVIRKTNPNWDTTKPCLYVGMSGLPPEERFRNHMNGVKAARIVRRYGVRLLPELYEFLNPMPFAAAAAMERELAEDLRAQGYAVAGGH